MSKLAKALTAAAGNAGGESLYVEDVFSTYLYTGNGSTQTITNGIDLAGEGGAVWFKDRTLAANHRLFDTSRGYQFSLIPNGTGVQTNHASTGLTGFNSNGFGLGAAVANASGSNYASWTFRKAEKFFDVVTYTGNGVAGRTVAHNLGSVPGCMIIKKLSSSTDSNWAVYHRETVTPDPAEFSLLLNSTAAAFRQGQHFNDTEPTSTEFTLGNSTTTNLNSATYVAYLFAHDAGGFGDDGSESIIKCGSYTGTGVAGLEVDLGFEPQWILWKNASQGNNWNLYDNMRSMSVSENQATLYANRELAELTYAQFPFPTATGFIVNEGGAPVNASGDTHIYIAIRRPMKTPESGTEVFTPNNTTVSSGSSKLTTTYPVDSTLTKGNPWVFNDRLRGAGKLLFTTSTGSETSGTASAWQLDFNNGYEVNAADIGAIKPSYAFRRATGFFDVVCFYATAGTAVSPTQTFNHNLGVIPELAISKTRGTANSWFVYSAALGTTKRLRLQSDGAEQTAAYFTALTSTTFTIDNYNSGTPADNNVAYLFATLAGVSKVGSYTGNGTSQTIDCGFSGGARFILIKRTDSTGDWYVWDSARGIVAGNDPHLSLNTTAAEVTTDDSIDPDSSGFIVNQVAATNINVSSASYIYLSIA